MAGNDQWISIQRDAAIDAWNVGEPTQIQLDDLILRARIVAGVAPGDSPAAATVVVSRGDPHPRTLLRMNVRPISELNAVDPAAVIAHKRDQMAAWSAQRQNSIADSVAALPTEEERTALRTRLGWNGGPRPNGA